MSRPRKSLLFGLVALLLAGLTISATRSIEPVYQGKSLSQWLALLDPAKPAEAQAAAEQAFEHFGPAALPFLVSELEHKPSKLLGLLNQTRDKLFPDGSQARQQERRRLQSRESERITKAIEAVGRRSPESLGPLLHNPASTSCTAQACVSLGGRGVDLIVGALNDPDPQVRLVLCATLEKVKDSPAATVALLQRTGDRHPSVTGMALMALGFEFGKPPFTVRAVRVLAFHLSSEHAVVRHAAVAGLANHGTNAAWTAPLIRKLADDDPDPAVRASAVQALGRVQ
ncbi:MAG: HEAT repeat domain-containing protein [Verrucomicrobiota bacterium]